ncbi:MAG: rhodanese-like domain-containing protein [Acetobacteraceae bacterium]|nr:rhodanese-like domain-containing protein [Acetobacteraceae bacterium]
MTLINLTAAQLAEQLKSDSIILIDVRETHEFNAGHIDGAILMPLSSFDPSAVPLEDGKPVVIYCARGGRSANAVAMCQQFGVPVEQHLAEGIMGWVAAGLPVMR